MSKFKKVTFNSVILIFFFTWGMVTLNYKIFPYNFIRIVKDNTYDKIFKIVEKKTSINFVHYHNKYPDFAWRKPYIDMYRKKMNIWVDRHYYNHKNDQKLLNFYIVKNLRHSEENIYINFLNDVEIYRAICKINDNSEYSNWEMVNFTVAIIGNSCVHTKVVRKKFKRGVVVLKSGGPVSSDPIFIQGIINIDKTKIVEKIK